MIWPFCEREHDYPMKYLLYLIMPWMFLVVDVCLFSFSLIRDNLKQKQLEAVAIEDGNGGDDNGGEGATASQATTTSRASKRGRAIGALNQSQKSVRRMLTNSDKLRDFGAQTVVNLRLMYLPLCGRTFDMLRCTTVTDNVSRLSKDVDLVCWEGIHQNFMPVVVLAFLVYVIGVPASYIFVLFRGYRNNELYSKEHLRRWGLLYGRFEQEYFFWELMIMLRRMCVVVVRIFLNIRLAKYLVVGYMGNYQAALTAVVMAIFMAIHFYTHPFQNPFLDFGDACYMGATFISSMIGICFSTAKTVEEVDAMQTLWFLNLFAAGLITVVLIWLDIENVHPRAKVARKFITKKLGLNVAVSYVESKTEKLFEKESRFSVKENIEDAALVNYFSEDKVFAAAVRASIAQSMADCAESVGIKPHEIDVNIETNEEEPTCLVIDASVNAPAGISTESLKTLLDSHQHSEVLESLTARLRNAFHAQSDVDTDTAPTECFPDTVKI